MNLSKNAVMNGDFILRDSSSGPRSKRKRFFFIQAKTNRSRVAIILNNGLSFPIERVKSIKNTSPAVLIMIFPDLISPWLIPKL